jgi:hypothetical protein
MKFTKSDNFHSLEICTILYKICKNLSFLCILEYEVVCIEIYTIVVYTIGFLEFCVGLFKTLKYKF